MAKENSELVDQATQWLSNRNAVYLAKEDVITWFCSNTGSKLDEEWHSCSLDQAKRMIGYTGDETTTANIIQALQELGVIYESAVYSVHDTPPHIFNYNIANQKTPTEKILVLLMSSMKDHGLTGMINNDIMQILEQVGLASNTSINLKEKNQALSKYASKYGYVAKVGTSKMNLFGTKKTGLIREGLPINNLIRPDKDTIQRLTKEVQHNLKELDKPRLY